MKRCHRQGCENTFGPGTRGELARQQFCSPSCGRVPRNSRTHEILLLASEGKTTAEIAEIVEVTRQWVRMVRVRGKNT